MVAVVPCAEMHGAVPRLFSVGWATGVVFSFWERFALGGVLRTSPAVSGWRHGDVSRAAGARRFSLRPDTTSVANQL